MYGPWEEMSEDMSSMVLQINNRDCWDEWERVIRTTFNDMDVHLTPREAFDSMRAFIQIHADYAHSEDYQRILDDSQYEGVDEQGAPKSPSWRLWLDAFEPLPT
jgi:hypothetical protein